LHRTHIPKDPEVTTSASRTLLRHEDIWQTGALTVPRQRVELAHQLYSHLTCSLPVQVCSCVRMYHCCGARGHHGFCAFQLILRFPDKLWTRSNATGSVLHKPQGGSLPPHRAGTSLSSGMGSGTQAGLQYSRQHLLVTVTHRWLGAFGTNLSSLFPGPPRVACVKAHYCV
jgi:hypothetical protein